MIDIINVNIYTKESSKFMYYNSSDSSSSFKVPKSLLNDFYKIYKYIRVCVYKV